MHVGNARRLLKAAPSVDQLADLTFGAHMNSSSDPSSDVDVRSISQEAPRLLDDDIVVSHGLGLVDASKQRKVLQNKQNQQNYQNN